MWYEYNRPWVLSNAMLQVHFILTVLQNINETLSHDLACVLSVRMYFLVDPHALEIKPLESSLLSSITHSCMYVRPASKCLVSKSVIKMQASLRVKSIKRK